MSNLRRAHGPTAHAIRRARGLPFQTVAERAQISTGYLSKIERGIRRPEENITVRLAAALDVDVEILTGQRPAIATIRTALGIDAGAFAADIGIGRTQLVRIERGTDLPDTELLAVIARRLGVTIAALDTAALAAA